MSAVPARQRSWLPVYEPQVDHALFLLGYQNLLGTSLGQIGLAGLVALATYKRADPLILGLWLGYLVLAGAGYLLLRRMFKTEVSRAAPNEAGVKRWYRYRRTLQVISAVGWGGLGFLMVPQEAAHNVIVMAAFTGVVGHSAAGNSANDLLGFLLSACMLVLVFVLRLPAIFGDDAPTVLAMCVFYIVVLTAVLRNTHYSLRESIHLRLNNEALAASNAEQAALARQANRDKSEFLAAASHDLRQPVHALLLLIEAYRQQVPAAMNHPLMQHITLAGQSINSLFGALMELSRLEGGAEKPVLTEVNLLALVHEAAQHVQPETAQKGLDLRRFQARGLDSVRVSTDQVLAKRVLVNLLSNALRYTHRGGVLLALRRAHGGNGLWIEVWDTGIGISAVDQVRIFDPYVQIANRERDRSKGLGLGLAISKQACELLGLSLGVRSVPGRGSCFRIGVPASLVLRHDGSCAAPGASVQPKPVVKVSPWLQGRRVLLVDDDPMVQVAMLALLRGWSLDVRSATRGDDSVLAVCGDDWVPECVLCDFRLPGPMNGIEVLDWLQQQFPKAIGVLLTGELIQTVQQDAEDAGYLLLSKPVDAEVLAFTLGALLERRHEERNP